MLYHTENENVFCFLFLFIAYVNISKGPLVFAAPLANLVIAIPTMATRWAATRTSKRTTQARPNTPARLNP